MNSKFFCAEFFFPNLANYVNAFDGINFLNQILQLNFSKFVWSKMHTERKCSVTVIDERKDHFQNKFLKLKQCILQGRIQDLLEGGEFFWFSELSQKTYEPIFSIFFWKIEQARKRVSRLFWEKIERKNFDFFAARAPLQYRFAPKALLEKLKCRSAKNKCAKIVPKGALFGSAVGQIPEMRGDCPPLPPPNSPLVSCVKSFFWR